MDSIQTKQWISSPGCDSISSHVNIAMHPEKGGDGFLFINALSALFIPVGGKWFPELHTVVPADIAVLGGISQWAA